MTKRAYQLFNPIEQVVRPLPLLNNVTQETAHPMVPAVYIQLQAEALFGVRLGAVRLSALLAQFYGYRIVGAAERIERVDVRLAREEAEVDEVYHNEALDVELGPRPRRHDFGCWFFANDYAPQFDGEVLPANPMSARSPTC